MLTVSLTFYPFPNRVLLLFVISEYSALLIRGFGELADSFAVWFVICLHLKWTRNEFAYKYA